MTPQMAPAPDLRACDTPARSLAHRPFTDDEEQRISHRIRHDTSTPGTLFTDEDFRMVAMEEALQDTVTTRRGMRSAISLHHPVSLQTSHGGTESEAGRSANPHALLGESERAAITSAWKIDNRKLDVWCASEYEEE
jgi:hypothetical protein